MVKIKHKGVEYEDNSSLKLGIDEYLIFDKDKNEIRMEIPFDVLFNPEKNKELGKPIE